MVPAGQKAAPKLAVATPTQGAEAVAAPLAGTIFKIQVEQGDEVAEGDVLIVLEAMKMETEIRAARSGVIQELHVKEGDSVRVGASLLSLA
ncbi:oxaloacetate decarboxylase [Vibrio cholerae]|nr:oxaloacetate decarboxylase [Vibrio cholerae]